MATDNAVYKYMKMQNRPYSVNDLVTNLHNEYNKSTLQKAMDQLVTEGKLCEKVYGKQKIYCIIQDSTYDTDKLMRIDKELQSHANEVERQYQQVTNQVKEQEALLASLRSSLSLEDAQREKIALQQSISKLTNKLDELMETSSAEDLHESKRKAEKHLDEYSREYVKRKRMCTDIIDCILENYSGSKEEFYDEVGIDSVVIK